MATERTRSTRKTPPESAATLEEGTVTTEEANVVLAASRVLVALSVESIAAVEDIVDVVQFRVLVVLASTTPLSLGELAESAGLHLSRASRICDRLVGQGLVSRADDPADRRVLTLRLTSQGSQLVQRVMRQRQKAVTLILSHLTKRRRTELVRAFGTFAAAGGEVLDQDLWAAGWTT